MNARHWSFPCGGVIKQTDWVPGPRRPQDTRAILVVRIEQSESAVCRQPRPRRRRLLPPARVPTLAHNGAIYRPRG
jgi:hypothetical protein